MTNHDFNLLDIVETTLADGHDEFPGGVPLGTKARVGRLEGDNLIHVEWIGGKPENAGSVFHYSWFKPVAGAPAIGEVIDTADRWNLLPIGAIVTDRDGWVHTKIADYYGNGRPTATYVDTAGEPGTFSKPWQYDAVLTSLPESEEGEPVTKARPTVTLTHETSRKYAADLSGITGLQAPHDQVLRRASEGQEVDAQNLRKAATAAISVVLGKKSWPIADREARASKARHLIYKADAVIENHIDGLPAYAAGERSRKIEALETERDEKQRLIDEATRLLTEARTELEAAVARAEAAEQQAAVFAEHVSRVQQDFAAIRDDRESQAATVEFAAREFGDGEHALRVLQAFTIGYRESLASRA